MDLRLIVDGLGDIKHTDNNTYTPSVSRTKYPVKPITSSEALSPITGSASASAPVSGCVSPPASPPDMHMLNIRQNMPAYSISSHPQSSTDKVYTLPVVDYSGYLPERYSHPKHSNPPLVVPSSRKKAAARAAKYPGMVPVEIKSGLYAEQRERSNSFPAFIPILNSPTNSSPSCNHATERYPSPPHINPSTPYMPLCRVAYPLKQGYVQVVPSGCVIASLPSSSQSVTSSPTTLSASAPSSTSATFSGTPYYPPPPVYHPPPPINQTTPSPNVNKESPQHSHTRLISSPERGGHCNSELSDDNPNNSKYWRFVDESSRDSGKPTVTANSLKQHILILDADTNAVVTDKTNTTAKKFKYGCQQCGRAFFRKSDLVRHIQIHLGIKPNACGVCGKQFIQRSALTVHLRVHTGEKPFGCPRCGRAFSDSSSLARHRRIHERNANAVVERITSSQSQVSVNGAK